MTAAKIESKTSAAAADGIQPWIETLYSVPAKRVIGVVELAHVLRTQPAPDADKEAEVRLRISHLEIARPEQEQPIRDALRALYLHRTAYGTLDEDSGQLELSQGTLEACADSLHALEAARLRAGVKHWLALARKTHEAAGKDDASLAAVRYDLGILADGLAEVLYAAEAAAEPAEGEG